MFGFFLSSWLCNNISGLLANLVWFESCIIDENEKQKETKIGALRLTSRKIFHLTGAAFIFEQNRSVGFKSHDQFKGPARGAHVYKGIMVLSVEGFLQ